MNLNDYDILSLNLHFLKMKTSQPKKNLQNDPISKLNKNSFNKANSSLMCSLIHFLMISLDPTTQETLRFCYPVVTLSDLKLFKDTVYPLLQSILPQNIIPGRSVLDGAKGERMIKFLRNFSDYVIKSKIPPTSFDFLPELAGTGLKPDSDPILQMKKNILVTHIANMKEIIYEKSKQIDTIQNKWKAYANKLTDSIQKAEKEKKVLQNKVASISRSGVTSFSEIASIDRAPKIENHRDFIGLLSQVHTKFCVESEFKDNLGYIAENSDLYDMITPETLSKKQTEDFIVLQDEAQSLNKRVKEDNEKFKSKKEDKNYIDNTEKITNLTSELIKKIEDVQKGLESIDKELNN